MVGTSCQWLGVMVCLALGGLLAIQDVSGAAPPSVPTRQAAGATVARQLSQNALSATGILPSDATVTPSANVAPQITTAPQSQKVVAGGNVSFSVVATGTAPLAYQWRKNGEFLSGQTGTSFALWNVSASDAADYDVVVTNVAGSITSTPPATLTVAPERPVVIPDPNLEAAIRSALAKPTGSLTKSDLQTLKSLSGSSRNITNLSSLEWATNLQTLALSYNAISDLTPLQGLNGLVDLALDRNQISNLSPLTNLKNLRGLALGGNPITSYTVLAGLTNLTRLALSDASVTSLSVVQNLTRLTQLSLYANQFADLSPLRPLTNLTDLDLRRNFVTNYTLLANLTNLTRLRLGENGLSDTSFLRSLPGLTYLDLDNDTVRDLSPLTGLTNLDYLVLSGNPGITNYPVLSALTRLVNLELRGDAINSLAFVTNLSRLQFADFSQNNITDSTPLLALTNLMAVNLSANPNTNAGPLFTRPSNLWLFKQSISNVSFLSSLTQLTALGLDDNLVADPSPLSGLTNLSYLGLNRNPLSNYGALAAFTNLTGLGIEGNSCTDLNFVKGLTSLRHLNLRNNRFGDLTALAGLTNLDTLYAAYNRLTDITALTNLPSLSRVELSGNLLNLSAGSSASMVIQNLQSRGVGVDYLPTNQPPALAISPVWYIAANQTSSISFFAADALVTPPELTMTASSSNPGLLPNSGITFGGTNSNRVMLLCPAANQTGSATVTLTANQPLGGLSTTSNLLVNVMFSTNISFQSNLAAVVSAALGITGSKLTSVDLMRLTGLYAESAHISSLTGLEGASNLITLNLDGNLVTNLAPLRNLTGLISLSLNDNRVADVSPLAGLTNLIYLALNGNPVTNMAVLSSLTNLGTLYLENSGTTNISFLTNLLHLVTLDLSENHLSDITPLGALTNLTTLFLSQNRLTNIGPLASLPNLSYVDLSLNLLNAAAAGMLQSNGVTVQFLPQRTPPWIDVRTNWVVAVNTNSRLSFTVFDTGPDLEVVGVGVNAANPDLAVGLIPDSNPGSIQNWVLAATNQMTTNAFRWITLMATNDVGLSTNVAVLAQLITLVPVTGQWLGATNLTWSGDGDAPWFGQTVITHSGFPAVQSGAIGNKQTSILQATVLGPGQLTFWWKVSSETNYDWLEFSFAGYTNRICGEVDWQLQTFNIPPGLQTLRWSYIKDKDTSRGMDAAWVSQVAFVPEILVKLTGGISNAQARLLLYVVPSNSYQIQVSTNLVNWSTLTAIVPTSNVVQFLDTNATARARFYRLRSP